ncbi:DMT family transporter [Bartonella tamiae]|uniref:EamA domain-containing protein n=1 Tax=Bartonella tamiae Th239 TaxID=1094558 RepID=J1K340_9HYPH|nr:EamA family transporter [Bartonella tamiae]EJF91525.1 hypothetical protein ME5_00220 [Bartonella tamiae Th239]EJF92491.1 hypothetical protein MEG_01661 [Bartonella tamiae Th307]
MYKATAIGFLAVLMWALLATLTTFAGNVPSLLLTAITLFIGALPGIVIWIKNPKTLKDLKQPYYVWLIGIGGLFGYHFFYFTAMHAAPPIEVALINYLWPLFIVLGSALMPGEKLRWFHLTGAALGFAGMIFIITGKGGFALDTKNTFGYLSALASAVIWASYSLLSRRVSKVPTTVVTAFCLGTSLLAFAAHVIFKESFILPSTHQQWFAVILIGLFPAGMAFYCWDYGVKHGNIQLLGVASYSAPLISTLIMILTGLTEATWRIWAACILITFGAVLASKNIILKPKHKKL